MVSMNEITAAAETFSADVAIIGGGCAGLSAALILGRSRRKVIVFDHGRPRNDSALFAYGYFTRDKTPPRDLLAIGRAQLSPYDVTFIPAAVHRIKRESSGFMMTAANGDVFRTPKVLLATGLKDSLPAIPGLSDHWGSRVYSCPYCDGWEMRDKPIVVIATGEGSYEYVLLIRHWTDSLTFFVNSSFPVNDKQRRELAQRQITCIETPIVKVEKADEVLHLSLEDGTTLPCHAIFTHPECHIRKGLISQLGCDMTPNQVTIDDAGRTTIPGLYAAGDIALKSSLLVTAASSGAIAAMAINQDLIKEKYA